eukprot:1978089-Prymnesium_polylepis.1
MRAHLLESNAVNDVQSDPADVPVPCERPPRCGPRRKAVIALAAVVVVILLFGVAVAVAPSAEAVCHRLNLTTSSGRRCVEGHDGPVCPAQGTDCTVLSNASYDIQGTECVVIGFLLLAIWYREKPRRHPVQFCADNSKSIVLALTTHSLVIVITAALGDVTNAHCDAGGSGGVSLHPGAQPCDWYLVTFLMDDLVGVPLTLVLYVASARLAARVASLEPLSRVGDYEARRDSATGMQPPSSNGQRVLRWAAQVTHWIGCALVARALETGLLFALLHPLMRVANGLGWWACTSGEVLAKQWINLMVLPIGLDAIQFTVQNYVFDGREWAHDGEQASKRSSANTEPIILETSAASTAAPIAEQ